MAVNHSMREKESWDCLKEMLGNHQTTFGAHWSYNFRKDPKRLAFVLSRYKFAAKMACKKGAVLELGCSEGIGSHILAENMERYVGVDFDTEALEAGRRNFNSPKFEFVCDDFMNQVYGSFDAVVSLDVVEHIPQPIEDNYFKTIYKNLAPRGICVVGTPNIDSAIHASPISQIGHVNLFSLERLKAVMLEYFQYALPFSMNDEVMHTGFAGMSHYIFCVGFEKRENI